MGCIPSRVDDTNQSGAASRALTPPPWVTRQHAVVSPRNLQDEQALPTHRIPEEGEQDLPKYEDHSKDAKA
ncbi:hypothetical protein M407DRAFT_246235 [Tulasnella calospora MUT 4182]|uniref:Uncharacterized protein n=1 Tax=Tulasnella calospora MUT 4182 TaxID=1051891 RepID=A0A0C3Q736_9AGAM|nr:hypothetical protein M407DRAFT_246235 [Tulasnella calospora MUT 4182]